MLIGVCICYNTNRVADREIVVNLISLLRPSGVADHIAEIWKLDNVVRIHSWRSFDLLVGVTDQPTKLCHYIFSTGMDQPPLLTTNVQSRLVLCGNE